MRNDKLMTGSLVAIESAECLIPRRGATAERIRLREELRRDEPALAKYLDEAHPIAPDASDDVAVLQIAWTVEPSDEIKEIEGQFPIQWDTFNEFRLTKPRRYSEPEYPSFEFGYILRASFALEVLKMGGHVPADATLANEDEWPMSSDREGFEKER